MIKKILIICLLEVIQLSAADNQFAHFLQEHQHKIEVCAFTELIFKRFYYIIRLEHVIFLMKTIKATPRNHVNLDFINTIDVEILFEHPLIKEVIAHMKLSKSLESLEIIWQDFKTYKFLDNELFLDEVTKLIFIISQKLLLHAVHDVQRPHILEKSLAGSIQERLEYIDLYVHEFFDRKNTTYFVSDPLRLNHIVTNFTESVSDRLYYIKRLENAINTLLHLNVRESFLQYLESSRIVLDPMIHFSHERINYCVEHMESEKNLAPLFMVWDEFVHYKYLNDKLFVPEFIKLIFVTYKNIAINQVQQEKKSPKTLLQQLQHFYEKLDSLPLEELLNAIDLLAHELPKISQEYELNSSISWREWFRKYWWAPPVIAGTLVLKVLLIIRLISKQHQPVHPACPP